MAAYAPRPAHLGPRYAAMFEEPDVARSYAGRPPYPDALFDVLGGLADPACPVVLDVGAGTGDLARPLARRFHRVDAVDPSRAMIEAGRRQEGGDAPTLRWILGAAETAPIAPPYGLVVAGQSLAWMEWSVVLPRWREALTPGAFLAIVERTWDDAPWRAALGPIIARHSANREYRPYDLLGELTARGLFQAVGHRELPGEVESTVEAVLDGFHSQNGLARHSLGASATAAFDSEARAELEPFARQGRLRIPAGAVVTWGRPT